jgi:hypothetical protein
MSLAITFTLLMLFGLLWTDNIIGSFLFMLHHQEILFTGLLNSLKEHEVRVIYKQRNINIAHLFTWKKLLMQLESNNNYVQ